jgi:phosphoribosylaminoimidazole carboxylase / phosphoribosylaminoimidazole-succinocarboxamide synthase
MKKYEKADKLIEGKTKIIWSVQDNPDLIIIENKKDITAFDDPKFTKQFELKAQYATTTTCKVFELLQKAAIPVAYEQQLSPTEFTAPTCEMIPLEVVARRYAVGSYLKRKPELTQPEGKPPFRFDDVYTEFFLKTTKGQLIGKDNKVLVSGLDAKKGEEDPLIANPKNAEWKLLHPKKQPSDPDCDLGKFVQAKDVVDVAEVIDKMEDILKQTFLALEQAWQNLYNYRLIDMKIEFGITTKGKLVVSDVIDNDSWRLRDSDWNELSKEAFRQGEELSDVEKKYGLVAELVKKF